MKKSFKTLCCLVGALLLITILPLSSLAAATEEGEKALLALPEGETAAYTRKIQEQWVLCLPLTLDAPGLNESLFLQSGQVELVYDGERLQYLGTSEMLLDEYACAYADPATGLTVKQGWVVNGTETGRVRLAFASGYGCSVAGNVLIELCFAFTDAAMPGDALNFSMANANFTFADRNEQTILMDTFPGAAVLTLSTQADRSILMSEYGRHYSAVYGDAGELAISIGDTRDLVEGTPYLSSADLKISVAALSAAYKVLNNGAATQEEIDNAVAALQRDFIFPVAHRLSYEELEGKIGIAEEKIQSSEFASYSVQLQKKWQDALKNAQALLTEEAKTTNTQRKLDNAAKAITELVKTGEAEWVLLLPVVMLLCAGGLVVVMKKRRSLENK